MGLLASWLTPPPIRATTPNAGDDRWFGVSSMLDGAGVSSVGTVVSETTALKLSTIYRCVTLLGWTVGSLPLGMYRWLDPATQEGSARVPDHPLDKLLWHAPNRIQSSYDWRAQMMGHLLLRGNAYHLIVPGARGFVDQLVPLMPDGMQVEYSATGRRWRLADDARMTPGGILRYVYTTDDEGQRVWLDEDVFHVRGFSRNGLMGMNVLSAMRNAVGLAVAAETHGARYLGNGFRPAAVIEYPGRMEPDVAKNFRESLAEFSGPGNAGKVPILTQGMTLKPWGMSAEDAQYIESRQFQVEDLLRFLGVPGVLVGHNDKTATFASAEQFFLSFAKHSVEPWLCNVESALSRDLILGDQKYFARFNRDQLVRGDLLSRWQAYEKQIGTRVRTVNEIRADEGWNPIAGGDERESESLAAPAREDRQPVTPTGRPRAEDEAVVAREQWASRVVRESAARIVRRELEAVERWAPRYASDVAGWRKWVESFYAKQLTHVISTLAVPESVAREYVGEQQAQLLGDLGVSVIDTWPTASVERLTALAWAHGPRQESAS